METCATVALSRGGAVTMAIDAPRGARQGDVPLVVLAHGAGNDFRSPFLEFFASSLSASGFAVARFNFPYKERGGARPPDRMDALMDCMQDVIAAACRKVGAPPAPLAIGGKSMGARVASMLAAEGRVRPTSLVFLGYPLHKPGDTANLRAGHLAQVKRPMLFVQGTRDPFCDLELLRKVRKDERLAGSIHVVDGGEHSFALPASRRAEQQAALDGAARSVAEFVRRHAGAAA
ncbi:MAG: hypothetical protein HMLKMBBP_03092 [Planctomycetes bacterium]|nr:hypothetical protein [Planctomycetota bacterium]